MKSKKDLSRVFKIRAAEKGRKHPLLARIIVKGNQAIDRKRFKGNFDCKINNSIAKFAPKCGMEITEGLKEDVWKAVILNLIDPDEYFLFHFYDLTAEERHQFVGNREKEQICGLINSNGAWEIFTDKWRTYQKFEPYYKREAIKYSSSDDAEEFKEFYNRHTKVIIKGEKASRGRGISFADHSEAASADEVLKKMNQELDLWGGYIVEEYIRQADELAQFHPESVNTVRIATFRDDNEVKILFAFLRCGRNGTIVDNGGSGGLFTSIDIDTGVCNTDTADKDGNRYQKHPDSQIEINGFHVPEWQQALDLSRTLAGVVPEQRYVGWDLAYTQTGWVMIEGNSWAQFGSTQVSYQKGIRPLINNTFYKYIGV